MASISNKTAEEIESTYVGESNYGDVLERSIDLSIGILIGILNLVEIIIILKIKRKKKVYEILLLSLSASDFMLCLSNTFIKFISIRFHALFIKWFPLCHICSKRVQI